MLDKSQKMLLAIIVAASIALATVMGGLWYYDNSKNAGKTEVDVRIFGNGWNITANDVVVDNATALVAVRQVGADRNFSVLTSNGTKILSINGTAYKWPYHWKYGVNGLTSNLSVSQQTIKDDDVLTFWYTDNATSTPPSGTITVKLFGNGWNMTASIGVENVTALKALMIAGDYKHFSIVTAHYVGMGDLVTAINGTVGTANHFWLFGVNGVSSSTGADATFVHAGDTLTFWFTSDFASQPPGD